MYAVYTEVSADESHIEEGRAFLADQAVPMVREHGAKAAFWLAPQGGRGISIVVFDTEDEARHAAATLKVGEQAGTNPDVRFTTVEVREVIASL